jgi:rhamnosyltransferase
VLPESRFALLTNGRYPSVNASSLQATNAGATSKSIDSGLRPGNICAIVPTYRPDPGFQCRMELAAAQVGCLIVVDDSGDSEIACSLDAVANIPGSRAVLHNPSNQGLAASLNRGFEEARRRGYRWVLTLDDDTTLKPDMCQRLSEGWALISQSVALGILAMSWQPGVKHGRENSRVWSRRRIVITSGTLMSMDTFNAVGPFREDFIIDAVDSDYCIRVRAHGLSVIRLADQGFVQRLGEARTVGLGPLRVALNEHSPLRTYYRVRNSAALVKQWKLRELYYAAGVVYANLQQFVAAVCFYKNKAEHLKAMTQGLCDAWSGISGFDPRATTRRGKAA